MLCLDEKIVNYYLKFDLFIEHYEILRIELNMQNFD